jgi:predicted dehydrogenase
MTSSRGYEGYWMAMNKKKRIFNTDRRIRLGIWGLGRGMSFYEVCAALNFDVVAGCDYNEHMRKGFAQANPRALVTADEREFLAADFDAVLLATYCPAHAGHAVKCLKAGKHVLSEVTAFFTPAEGVRLVEEVERSGLVYNLAENYPFMRANLWLADQWRKGLFGELEYAEYEYVHECLMLSYTYIDGVPVQPGWTAHNWRSWINYHYYNTHSLGPVMHITGLRPKRVVALPAGVKLAGYLPKSAMDCTGTVAPSLITMSNGAIMRNLMGATTNDSHHQRLWGTKGSAESGEEGLSLRLGGSGGSPKLVVEPVWPELGEMAETMGHGGGDFWVLYHFAKHILFGKPAFFNVHTAADCTLPGILAYRSAMQGGKAFDVPDFRQKRDRDAFRKDEGGQKPHDLTKVFPAGADRRLTAEFTAIMKDLYLDVPLCRGIADWLSVAGVVKNPAQIVRVADDFLARQTGMRERFAKARTLARAYPKSDGGRVINEMLELADSGKAMTPSFIRRVRRERVTLRRISR